MNVATATGEVQQEVPGEDGVPIQSLNASADVQVDIKPVNSCGDAIIQEAEVSTSKKKRGSGTGNGARPGTTPTTATPTPASRVESMSSYFDPQFGLPIQSRIHEMYSSGLGAHVKPCALCGLEMPAADPATMHPVCQFIRRRPNSRK